MSPETHTDPDTDTDTPADDQRAKFQAALDAKKDRKSANPHAQASGDGAAKEHSSRSGGKRVFRRKSGG